MIGNTDVERGINTYVDWTPDGLVTLSHITTDDELDSLVLTFLPGAAARLAQMLLAVAEEAWKIRQDIEQGQPS
jgi:hypothetical protein